MTIRPSAPARTRLLPVLAATLIVLAGCASTDETTGSSSEAPPAGSAAQSPAGSAADSATGSATGSAAASASPDPAASATATAGTAGPGQPTSADAADGALLPPAEGLTQYPLTVTTALGEITIDERPERVVMASSWDGDLFAALGVRPVGTDEQVSFYPWVEEHLSQIETLWQVGDEQYPAEKIATTAPDLIVDTAATDPAAVEKIAAIAPVVGAPAEQGADATWQEKILLLGELFDLSTRAQQVIDDYDAQFEQIRTEHPEFAGKSVDYLVFWGGEYGVDYLNTAGSASEALFSDLGFEANPPAGTSDAEQEFSEELLGTLRGDVLVISQQADQGEFEEFYNGALLQSLESFKAGRVVVLELNSTDMTVSHNGELTDFHGHLGRSFSVGPLSKLEVAHLVTPLFADALK